MVAFIRYSRCPTPNCAQSVGQRTGRRPPLPHYIPAEQTHMVVRVAILSDLLIPSDLPHHEAVTKRPSPPPAPPPKNGAASSSASSCSSSFPPSAVSQARSLSHLQRMRELRSQSAVATPTLSPLNLQSPKISKIPRPAAGGGRAVAFALRAASKPTGGDVGSSASVRVVRADRTIRAASTLYSSGGSGLALRARPRVPSASGGSRHNPVLRAAAGGAARGFLQPASRSALVSSTSRVPSHPIACAWR